MTKQEELRQRTKRFAIGLMKLTRTLPNNPESWVITKQVLRSGTSVAANYRAAGRGRSRAEFVAKLGIVVEEADETVFWLELIHDAGLIDAATIEPLQKEAAELLRIFSAAYHTCTRNQAPV